MILRLTDHDAQWNEDDGCKWAYFNSRAQNQQSQDLFSCSESLCARETALTSRRFWQRRHQKRKKHDMTEVFNRLQSVFWFCENDVRSLHELFDFFVSVIFFFAVQLCSQQWAENFLNSFNYFCMLQMATFNPISYTYASTALRFKRAAAHCKPVLKQFSILDKLQYSKLSSTALDGLWLSASVTAAADNNEDYRSDIQGMFWDEDVWL